MADTTVGGRSPRIHRIWTAFNVSKPRPAEAGWVQALHRSVLAFLVDAESPSRLRADSDLRPARRRDGALRRREKPDPGAGANPASPAPRARIRRRRHDADRHGTTNLFAALDVATGQVIAQCKPRHRHQEFLSFLKHIDGQRAPRLDVHLVVDNYSTHKHAKVGLARRPATLPYPFHSHLLLLAQPGRDLVQASSPRRPSAAATFSSVRRRRSSASRSTTTTQAAALLVDRHRRLLLQRSRDPFSYLMGHNTSVVGHRCPF